MPIQLWNGVVDHEMLHYIPTKIRTSSFILFPFVSVLFILPSTLSWKNFKALLEVVQTLWKVFTVVLCCGLFGDVLPTN